VSAGKHTATHEQSPTGDTVARDAAIEIQPAAFKVPFTIKAVAFTCTVITLSWFFEGWREVSRSVTPPHVLVLVAGTTLTLVLLMVQGYWVYVEEKLKGNLRKRFGLYEKIYERFQSKKRTKGESKEES
jgi:hypothetical protein